MSDTSLSEYAADHSEVRRQKELHRRKFYFQSPQIRFRSYLVGWVRTVSEKLKFGTTTVHLAVYVMDLFMDNHTIDMDRLHLVALVCLHLAAKYEERDVRIPKISEMNSIVNNRYFQSDFQNLEGMILQFLDWGLDIPTASHFSEYYSLFTVTREDMKSAHIVTYENFWQSAQSLVKDYLDLTLSDVRMMYFVPSLVASACIYLARQHLHLSPIWTDKLEIITHYEAKELSVCINTILDKNITRLVERKRKMVDSPDHGYVTSGSPNSSPEGATIKRSANSNKNVQK